jgi:hypothetical protein
MSYTTPDRQGDPPIPPYRWVPGTLDPKYGSPNGCNGCAFRSFTATKIRCSRIPCQIKPGMVAQLIDPVSP